MRFRSLNIERKEKKILIKKISHLFDAGSFINGPQISKLEKKISQLTKRKYCVGVGSGTDALILSLRLLNLKKNDEIIIPCMSWISTANAVLSVGCKPVFADINEDLNISTTSIEKLITKKVKAIMYVNFGGRMCDIHELNKISKKYKIPLIEDGSQSFGAKYKNIINGQNGIISAISLNAMKVLGGIGEAGVILTNNKKFYNRLKIYRYAGMNDKKNCVYPSENYKIDTIQAIVILERLKSYKKNIKIRNINSKYIKNKLDNFFSFIEDKKDCFNSHYILTAFSPNRDFIIKEALKSGIQLQIHHFPLMCDMPFYKNKYRRDVKKGRKIASQMFSIPFYENLANKDIDKIIYVLKKISLKL